MTFESHLSTVVTMYAQHTRHLSAIAEFLVHSYTCMYIMPLLRVTPSEFVQNVWPVMGLQGGEKLMIMFSRFDTVTSVTDGRTDSIAVPLCRTCLQCIARQKRLTPLFNVYTASRPSVGLLSVCCRSRKGKHGYGPVFGARCYA